MNRILVVEDEPLIRMSLSKKIEAFHEYTAVSGQVSNGAEALDWLESYHADLCVVDVQMPVMNGLELIRRINEQYPRIVCIVVSSYDDFSYAKQSIQLGVLDYVLKPVDASVLHESLRKAFQQLRDMNQQKASCLLLDHIVEYQEMVDHWVECIRTLQRHSIKFLMTETIGILEIVSRKEYSLLNYLSEAWLNIIISELNKESFQVNGEQSFCISNHVHGEKTLTIPNAKEEFYQSALQKLENGANHLLNTIQKIRESQNTKVVEEVKEYINIHYGKRLNLQELSDHVSMSKNYLSHLFKDETGYTIWNYVLKIRMEKAIELLLHTSLRSYQIADEVGYKDSIHFSKLFKKVYGLSPSEYRKRMKR